MNRGHGKVCSRGVLWSDLTFQSTALAIGECSGGGREWERGATWEATAITQGVMIAWTKQ